ncbi:MAG: hypothetical protein KJN97_02105, partial [Deltaproteobacteria bacterium]|nr:hypothetical protein [Deltaproteobacteria bacterium]
MTILASITMPSFEPNERLLLRRIEGVLARHPYMRVDLGSGGPLSHELEGVLSARLALLHTEGPSNAPALRAKLRAWEAQLAAATRDELGSETTRLRYETALLLHPEPEHVDEAARTAAELTRITKNWEDLRSSPSLGSTLAEKAAQSRDFVRHGAILPVYWLRRRRIRKLLPNVVRNNPRLRETFSAIEQVGPLVDNFAFKGASATPLSTAVAIADLAFLYMQLADEFLDELAAAVGGHHAAGELLKSLYRDDTAERPLRNLSLSHLRKLGIWPDAHTTKFGMTLSELFDALDQVAATIDSRLADAGRDTVIATNLFLHHCFQTYLDEAELCLSAREHRADRMRLQETAWHFYRKNNMVMMLWLDLRARLLGLDPAKYTDEIRRWGYLLA